MISVLLPVYNAAATLPTALASVLRQSHRDFEVVAVDDGSTDDSLAILRRLAAADPRLRVVAEPHRGLVTTLQAGLERCRGEWLARFDADDLMHRDRLALQHAAAFDGVLGCAVQTFPRAGLTDGLRRYESWLNSLLTDAAIRRDLFVESPLAHPTVLLPTALLRSVGGYRDCGWPEDYDLWLRLAAAGTRFAKLAPVLHYWRDHPGRLSRGGGPYGRAAFRRCKLDHLLRSHLAERTEVVIWGAGDGGREWSRLLTGAGRRVVAQVDIDPAKIGGQVRGAPVVGPDWLRPRRPELLLLTVGVHGVREQLREQLAGWGYVEGVDFVCLA
ncbi:MAG: glycosyltransferase [Fimbriimonadaceae bacterium]|nr:glycosyltransferase [Fimbriimonadaceae bacterium]